MTAPKFVPNTGCDVAPALVRTILAEYKKLLPQIERAKAFVFADKTERTSVQIVFSETFDNYPEIVWFDIDVVLKRPRVLVTCFEQDTDAETTMGVIE